MKLWCTNNSPFTSYTTVTPHSDSRSAYVTSHVQYTTKDQARIQTWIFWMPVRCSYHRVTRGNLSTPTGVLMTYTLANTQFAGFAARSTLVLTTHAEKAYKERIELCLYNIYRLSSAPISELKWISDKTIWPVLRSNLVGSQFNRRCAISLNEFLLIQNFAVHTVVGLYTN